MNNYDVIIIGAGVSGSAVARELARCERRIAVLEAADDVCEGTSKANSGIAHAGFDAKPGTLKARMNVRGSRMLPQLSKELDFSYKQNGSLVLCFDKEQIGGLKELQKKGEENGVEGVRILSPEEVWEMEPHVSRNIVAALYAPTGGIVCPFGLNYALAENAAENGVEFFFHHKVTAVRAVSAVKRSHAAESAATTDETVGGTALQAKPESGASAKATAPTGTLYEVETTQGTFTAPIVINAAGVHADEIHNMVCAKQIHIVARKGEYRLLDKNVGSLVSATIFQQPSKLGKGILVTPTVHGNILLGPTAEDIEDKSGTDTTAEGLAKVVSIGSLSVDTLDTRQTITSFAGLRAHLETEDGSSEKADFLIEESKESPGFFDVAGIESPGLTSAPAIGEYVAGLVNASYPAPKKANFKATRKGIPSMSEASDAERKALIEQDVTFANVICRCELVTEGEILQAIHRPLGATTLDGVKRRTRAGMGRCQAGFCSPKVLEILSRELARDPAEIKKASGASDILVGVNKESAPTVEDIGVGKPDADAEKGGRHE